LRVPCSWWSLRMGAVAHEPPAPPGCQSGSPTHSRSLGSPGHGGRRLAPRASGAQGLALELPPDGLGRRPRVRLRCEPGLPGPRWWPPPTYQTTGSMVPNTCCCSPKSPATCASARGPVDPSRPHLSVAGRTNTAHCYEGDGSLERTCCGPLQRHAALAGCDAGGAGARRANPRRCQPGELAEPARDARGKELAQTLQPPRALGYGGPWQHAFQLGSVGWEGPRVRVERRSVYGVTPVSRSCAGTADAALGLPFGDGVEAVLFGMSCFWVRSGSSGGSDGGVTCRSATKAASSRADLRRGLRRHDRAHRDRPGGLRLGGGRRVDDGRSEWSAIRDAGRLGAMAPVS